MCDGVRALAAVSPGCLVTVVKSHRTWIPTLCANTPLLGGFKCWTAVLSDPLSRPGAMLLCS